MPIGPAVSRFCAAPRLSLTFASTLLVGVVVLAGGSTRSAWAAPGKRDQVEIARQSREEARQHAERSGNTDEGPRRHSVRGDASRVPRMFSPTVQAPPKPSREPVVGWSAALDEPEFNDRRRRLPPAAVPPSYASALHVGERFVFDVFFAGNPAGLAEAAVVEYVADGRGEAPQGSGKYRLEGRAVTSGVIALLSTMEDRITTWVDSGTGAVVQTINVLDRSGLGTSGKYKKRVTETDFEGRGYIRIVDARDEKTTKRTQQVPRDTFDALSAMAWVRSLDLGEGDIAVAHVLDGTVLLKVEVVGRGHVRLDPLPSIAQGLGVKPGDVIMLEGTLSRVDRYGIVREDKRKYTFRAYMTQDDRRLLLAIETDMWLGVLRLVLNRYDPPRPANKTPEPVERPGSDSGGRVGPNSPAQRPGSLYNPADTPAHGAELQTTLQARRRRHGRGLGRPVRLGRGVQEEGRDQAHPPGAAQGRALRPDVPRRGAAEPALQSRQRRQRLRSRQVRRDLLHRDGVRRGHDAQAVPRVPARAWAASARCPWSSGSSTRRSRASTTPTSSRIPRPARPSTSSTATSRRRTC